MAEVFNVTKRTEIGRDGLKRLRRSGQVPAILYGHGEASVALSVPLADVTLALKHSGKVVNLKGDLTEEALIREVQWDTFGIDVLHIDLMRVSETETVEVTLQVHLKGEAPGVKQGGVVAHITHEVKINCPVSKIPESLTANLANLQVNGAVHASDVELPPGATLASDPHVMIASCNVPKGESEVATGVSIEPELIRKAKEEKEGA